MEKLLSWLTETALRLFSSLGDTAKAFLLLLLIALIVVLAVMLYARWSQARTLKKAIRRLGAELERVKTERDDLQTRLTSLDKVTGHVWLRPDSGRNGRFVSAADRKTRFVAFCNLKGGVGKTTLVANIGAVLGLRGRRVLVVDLDFQGTLSNLLLDQALLIEYRTKGWTSEVLLDEGRNPDEVARYFFPARDVPACHLMVARENLDTIEFAQQARFFVNETHEVRFYCRELLQARPVFDNFDYVLFDCPPRLSTACVNALTCADYVVIPTSLSQNDIDAVPRSLSWLAHLRPVLHGQFLGVIANRCKVHGGRLTRDEQRQLGSLNQLIERHVPGSGHVFSAYVPAKPFVDHATAQRRPAVLDPTEGRPLFEPVAEELERRIHR